MTQELTTLEKAALLSGKNVWQSRDLPRHGVPSFFMADGPHGVRKQVGSGDHLGLNASEPATCFPTSATVACSWDVELAEEVGHALGREAAALGVDVLLGPGLNLKRSPLGGRNFEYFSEDPYLSGKLAAGYVRGIQAEGVAATPKHFAVNSQELRRMASDSVVDERTLRELYLTAFEIVVREAAPRALMSSYNLVNGTYAHENRHLLTDILRGEWGFDGVVISDWGGSNDPVAAIAAGANLEMPAPGLDSVRQLVAAVRDGRLSEADLTARAAEVVRLALAGADAERPTVDHDAHHALARRAAEESMVLVRNEDAILPLSAGTRVALIGDMADTPRYQGAGSSQVNPTRLSSAREAIADSGLELTAFAQGYRRHSGIDGDLESEAVSAARAADVALVYLGLDEINESEGVDRRHIDLPDAQLSLLRAVAAVNRNVVVVLSAGSVVDLAWAEQTRAVLHGYLSGQAGAEAALRVLTGEVSPSGKLAETYPVSLVETPTFGRFPAEGRASVYREGLFVGYRHADAAGRAVRYPFGHGLSYTNFTYSDLHLTEAGAEFTITNTGPVAGAEIAQLYVSTPASAVVRPVKELKGFAKVHLAAGDSASVTIPFDRYTWRHFDATSGVWEIEGGLRRILVGASSADLRLSGELQVPGVAVDPTVAPETVRRAMLRGLADDEFSDLFGIIVPRDATSGALDRNDPLGDLSRARSPLGRLAHWILVTLRRRSEAKGEPDLNIQFLYNMPFRAIAKMSNGMVSDEMVDGIVALVNGHHFRGLRTIVGGFLRNRRLGRDLSRQLNAH
ncbi:glycoside hydrolase family 3 C-terminal domain-containing protein [Tessaracoccus sp. MC1756]|uniref:glycoside hydrolase family 3 C-terminal domain-containing protein n=1 Tax=Tessaracoccus sp. MC1756 TaxID=2760311 RepID=UPI001602DB08|nr:glycoside hydrolase family 3 C-terminal domain-containing protein [Tessaracoccus sp. MC1756]MBB1509789.1 glycoside hydrolase family 3 C-terminal domain-containing protein [Tessaracoccus sp. MC1756]